jgi:hypothetical protein
MNVGEELLAVQFRSWNLERSESLVDEVLFSDVRAQK